MSGWIKIHRKLQDWQWYGDSQMVHLFLHLLLEANHENRNWKGIEIKRGQLIFGRKHASETLGISEQSIRTCITRLKSTSEITIKSTNRFSLVTIVNYEEYQDCDLKLTSKSTSKSTFNQPATNQQSTTPKEVKNIRIKEINTKVFIPPSEIDIENYIFESLQNVKPEKIKNFAAAIFDFYTAKGWLIGRSKMKDWRAAVRNWIRNDDKFNNQNGKPDSNPKSDRIGRMARKDVEEFMRRPIIDISKGFKDS